MDTVFFWLSKIGWAVVAPDSLLVLLLISGCILLWAGKIKSAKILLSVLTLAVLVVAVFPVGSLLLRPIESRFKQDPEINTPVDGIIVLGGAELAELSAAWRQPELNQHAERFTAFIMLARRYPDAKLVFSSGSASLTNQQYKGADVAVRLFAEQGLEPGRITFERESRNTYENAVFSKHLLKPEPGERWILVTSADHMPRAVGIFCKLGWSVVPYPVDHQVKPEGFTPEWHFLEHLDTLYTAAYEWTGLLVYYATGKTDSLLPKSC